MMSNNAKAIKHMAGALGSAAKNVLNDEDGLIEKGVAAGGMAVLSEATSLAAIGGATAASVTFTNVVIGGLVLVGSGAGVGIALAAGVGVYKYWEANKKGKK